MKHRVADLYEGSTNKVEKIRRSYSAQTTQPVRCYCEWLDYVDNVCEHKLCGNVREFASNIKLSSRTEQRTDKYEGTPLACRRREEEGSDRNDNGNKKGGKAKTIS